MNPLKSSEQPDFLSVLSQQGFTRETVRPWKLILTGDKPRSDIIECVRSMSTQWAIRIMEQQSFRTGQTPEITKLILLSPHYFGFKEPPCSDDFLRNDFLISWTKRHLNGTIIQLC